MSKDILNRKYKELLKEPKNISEIHNKLESIKILEEFIIYSYTKRELKEDKFTSVINKLYCLEDSIRDIAV